MKPNEPHESRPVSDQGSLPIAEPLAPARENILLGTLAGIQFVHILDFMIMMPLGPILMRELKIGTHEFGLLVSAYTFSAAFTGLLAAAFIDRFGRKGLLLTMLSLFALATLACGLAPGYLTLLVARGAAGGFGGVLRTMIETIVADVIPFDRRGRASGTIMSALSLSSVVGIPLSLYLANHFGWRFPFIFIAALSCPILVIGWRMLPILRGHLAKSSVSVDERSHLLSSMLAVLRDANQARALVFMALIMFSGFSVTPYITIYLTANVGIRQEDVPLIYLFGGCATLFTSRFVGGLADRYGKVLVYRLMALCSFLPLFIQTHLGTTSLWAVIVCTTAYFIFVPGRMVPATAIVSSTGPSRLRGTFLSMNGSVQQFAAGVATYIGGILITTDASGRLLGYGNVGYLAIAATIIAIVFVRRIQLNTGPIDNDRRG